MLKNFLLLILIDILELQMDTNMIQLHYLKEQTFQVTTKMFIKIPINYNIYELTSKYFKSQQMAITKVLVWYMIICSIILEILRYLLFLLLQIFGCDWLQSMDCIYQFRKLRKLYVRVSKGSVQLRSWIVPWFGILQQQHSISEKRMSLLLFEISTPSIIIEFANESIHKQRGHILGLFLPSPFIRR